MNNLDILHRIESHLDAIMRVCENDSRKLDKYEWSNFEHFIKPAYVEVERMIAELKNKLNDGKSY